MIKSDLILCCGLILMAVLAVAEADISANKEHKLTLIDAGMIHK